MSKITSILSVICHVIYGAVCIQLTHLSYDDCENMCTLSYYHHQIGSIIHFLLFRVRSWNNVMRGMSLYILNKFFFLVLQSARETSWKHCMHPVEFMSISSNWNNFCIQFCGLFFIHLLYFIWFVYRQKQRQERNITLLVSHRFTMIFLRLVCAEDKTSTHSQIRIRIKWMSNTIKQACVKLGIPDNVANVISNT